MPTLRLFAHLRELAGQSRIEVSGSTVGEALDRAGQQLGAEFQTAARAAAVWRNGDPAERTDRVEAEDELALIPPVSGGSGLMVAETVDASLVTGLLGLLLLIGTNLAPGRAWWAAGLVLLIAIWTTDISARLEDRGREPVTVAVLTSLVLSVIAAHVWGGVGFGLALFIGVAVVMGWGVAVADYRSIESIAPSVVIALLGASAVGSLVLARQGFEEEHHGVSILILVTALAALAGYLLSQMRTPLIDPYSGTALGAVIGSTLGAVVWREDIVGYVLIGLGLAALLVAGRSLGSIIRTGRLALSETPPGSMSAFDGFILAASLYWPLVNIVL